MSATRTADGVEITDGLRLYDPYQPEAKLFVAPGCSKKRGAWVKMVDNLGKEADQAFVPCMYASAEKCAERVERIKNQKNGYFKVDSHSSPNCANIFVLGSNGNNPNRKKKKSILGPNERIIQFKNGEKYILSL